MYISLADYLNFSGADPPQEFHILGMLASDMIDQITGFKLNGNLDGLSDFAKSQVKKATCAQAQWIEQHGGVRAISSGLSNVSLGKFSFSNSGESGEGFSPLALRYLSPTGLLYAGVSVL